jgi:hypothetical protein
MEAFVVVGLDSGSNILSGSRASNHNDEHLTLRLPLRPNLTLRLPLPPSVTCSGEKMVKNAHFDELGAAVSPSRGSYRSLSCVLGLNRRGRTYCPLVRSFCP